MAEIEILPKKIVDIKTVILKSRFDTNSVKLIGEKLKTSFFLKFGFLKPNFEDILLIAFDKYYEPYILIGGKYSIDYCKRHNYALKVEDKTKAIFIDGRKLYPQTIGDNAKVINFVGEEHSHYEKETYLVLDKKLQEVPPENLFFAPSESLENRQKIDFDLRRPQISLEEEIAFLRSKIARRPSDIAEIVREIFEINERMTIYNPFYELTYKNKKNGKILTALINGTTGRLILRKFDVSPSRKLGEFLKDYASLPLETRFLRPEQVQTQVLEDSSVLNSIKRNPIEKLTIEKRADMKSNSPQPEGGFRFDAENATRLATDFMNRMGYSQGQFPTKLYSNGETTIVELKLQRGTAKVQIDAKTKEVKEYEILEEDV